MISKTFPNMRAEIASSILWQITHKNSYAINQCSMFKAKIYSFTVMASHDKTNTTSFCCWWQGWAVIFMEISWCLSGLFPCSARCSVLVRRPTKWQSYPPNLSLILTDDPELRVRVQTTSVILTNPCIIFQGVVWNSPS